MLADQSCGGHRSIHDDAMTERPGVRAVSIEGPTHFSQFVPLAESKCTESYRVRTRIFDAGG